MEYAFKGQLNIIDYVFAINMLVFVTALFRGWLPRSCFMLLCIFWRLAYNVGLGFVLRWQSANEWFTKLVSKQQFPFLLC